MALFHLYHDDAGGFTRERHPSISRLFRRVSGAFKLLHRGIANAKLHRLQSELLFRHDYSDTCEPEENATKFPQRPLILGDKWDF